MKKTQKTFYLILYIFIGILVFGLIPMNLFLCDLPIWTPWVGIGYLAVMLVIGFARKVVGAKGKVGLGIYFVFIAAIGLFGSYCNPLWNSLNMRAMEWTKPATQILSYEQAKEDLDYAMQYFAKVHPACLHGVPDEVTSAYENAISELKGLETIPVYKVEEKLSRIFSVLGDAHTCTYNIYEEEHYLRDIGNMKGKGFELVGVGGQTLSELLEKYKNLFCYEVESWELEMLKTRLSSLEGLYFLGYDLTDGIDYTWEKADGQQQTKTYFVEDFVTYDEYVKLYPTDGGEQEEVPFVYYTIDKEHSLALLTLMECNYNQEYRQCLEEMFTEIKKYDIQNVAVDIRENGGGNSLVVDEFISYLPVDTYHTVTEAWRLGCFFPHFGTGIADNQIKNELAFSGDVYVLTSSGSFSSAMMFAEYIKDNKLGTLIGEAPGNKPTGYGDIAIFRLPHSGIYMQVSMKIFYRADKETTEVLVEPDIRCEADRAMDVLYQTVGEE